MVENGRLQHCQLTHMRIVYFRPANIDVSVFVFYAQIKTTW